MLQKSANVVLITIVVALGGLLFGYDTAVISGATEALQVYFQLTPAALGFAAASALLGCVIGALISGTLSTRFGRRGALFIAAILFFISGVGTAIPTHYWTFVFYRIVGGVGVGLASMVSPMYIAEIAPPKKRGALVACNQFAIIFGMLVVYFVNYGIALMGDEQWLFQTGWRFMFGSEAFPAGLFFLLLFLVPETPRWLAMRHRDDEGFALVKALNGVDSAPQQWQEIKQSLAGTDQSAKITGKFTVVLFIGVMVSIFQQITGINVILYYAPAIFKSFTTAGTDVALLQTILVGVVNLSFTTVAIFTVDRFGRKPLMMIGSFLMAIAMLVIGTAAYLQMISGFLIVFMLIYIAAFAISLGPVVWVLLSEMFPNKIRSKALAIAVFAQWLSNFAVSQTFPMMNAQDSWIFQAFHGGFPFWLFGAMGILCTLFVYKYLPETKGKSLEELEGYWNHFLGSHEEEVHDELHPVK